MEVLDKLKQNIIDQIDYEEKVRVLSLSKRIEWFVDNKKNMSQNEKWDAFYDMVDDYDISKDALLRRVNNLIRKKGLSVWES